MTFGNTQVNNQQVPTQVPVREVTTLEKVQSLVKPLAPFFLGGVVLGFLVGYWRG